MKIKYIDGEQVITVTTDRIFFPLNNLGKLAYYVTAERVVYIDIRAVLSITG
jgi:hypothetical protein